MEAKEQPTVIFAFSIYWRVARVAAGATLYITIAVGAALAGGAVSADILRAASTASSTTAGALRKAKDCRKKQTKQSSSAKAAYT